MSEHTPGPWAEYAESGDWWIQQADSDKEPVGNQIICGTGPTKEADVMLICAAPDLLAACLEAHVVLCHYDIIRRTNGVDWKPVDEIQQETIDQLWKAIELAVPELRQKK